MSAEWFYADDEQQKGPIAEVDLRALLLSGSLPVDTLVWSEGMASWVSAEKVPDLYRPVQTPPPVSSSMAPHVEATTAGAGAGPAPSSNGNGNGNNFGGARVQASPEQVARSRQAWNRFLARITDGVLMSIVFALLFGVAAEQDPNFLEFAIAQVMTLSIFAFAEAFFISRWGMTPGKWIFRIRVVHQENRLLTYGEALRRGFQVLAQGMFFGIPPMVFLFEGLAFKELVDTGETQWDKRLDCQIQHAPMRGVHMAAAVGISVLLFVYVLAALGGSSA
ncbi:MAG: RDD family protein [Planctomycetota bacterium]|jgi:hypothetical protein